MTQSPQNHDLSANQKEEIDDMALARVEAMNSDEFICKQIDQKVHAMEENLKAYFHQRFDFHSKSNKIE